MYRLNKPVLYSTLKCYFKYSSSAIVPADMLEPFISLDLVELSKEGLQGGWHGTLANQQPPDHIWIACPVLVSSHYLLLPFRFCRNVYSVPPTATVFVSVNGFAKKDLYCQLPVSIEMPGQMFICQQEVDHVHEQHNNN